MTEPLCYPGEKWRAIPRYEGAYSASNMSRIRSEARVVTCKNGAEKTIRAHIMKAAPKGNRDYLGLNLSKDGKQVPEKVHQLVAEVFIGERPDGMDVCHIDGNKYNNDPCNLRYGTKSENSNDTVKHGTHWNASKEECPRKHPLIMPNLVKHLYEKGRGRKCKACDQAAQHIYRHPEDSDKFEIIADGKFEKIMAS